LVGVHAAGVGEHGVHPPAALLQPGHAEAGIQAAGEGEDDVFGIGDAHCLVSRWGPLPCIRESGRMRGTGRAPVAAVPVPASPAGGGAGPGYWRASAAITAFCTCRRFSASSMARQLGESITASVALTLRR